MADTGPVRCRRELSVSPITQSAGGKGMGGRGGRPDASPNCQTEEE